MKPFSGIIFFGMTKFCEDQHFVVTKKIMKKKKIIEERKLDEKKQM